MKRILASLTILIALSASAQEPAAATAPSDNWLKALCAAIPSAAMLSVVGAGFSFHKKKI